VVLDGLSPLEHPGTVAQWRQDHPNDSVTVFAPAQFENETNDWCAVAVSYRMVANLVVIRRAYFYVPPLTPSSALPPSGPPERVSQDCILGAVVMEVPAPDSAAGAMAIRITDSLAGPWGPSATPRTPFYYDLQGPRQVVLRGEWHRDSVVVVVGRQPAHWTLSPRAVAVGFLPVSELFEYHLDYTGESVTRAQSVLEQAKSLAGRDSGLARLLEAKGQYDSAMTKGVDPSATVAAQIAAARVYGMRFADAVALWVTDGKGLDSVRRAASFFLVDRVMKDVREFEDSVVRRRFERLGATFEEDHSEGWVYTGSWLNAADRLDARGPVHVLVVMERFNGECSPSQAIQRGERLLSSVRDSATRYQLYKILGNAWGDSVAAPGGPDADPATPVGSDVRPRAQAIRYYQAALALNRSLPSAVQSWREAWRLVAGVHPFWRHFYCDYD